MGKITAIQPLEINYKGEFNFEQLYKLVFNWLGEHKFEDTDGAGDKIEHLYYENIWTGGKLKELWIYWRTKRPESEYFEYRIRVDWHVLGMSKEEKIVEGKKIGTNNLEVSIFFNAEVLYGKDVKEDFDISNHWFTKHFNQKFEGTIHKKQMEDKKTELYNLAHELINTVKQHLGLLQDVPLQRGFVDPFGIPQLR